MNSNSTQQQTYKISKKVYGYPKPTGKCCFCSSDYCFYGNNTYPLSDNPNDKCCDACNKKVILARFDLINKQRELKEKRDEEGKTEEDAEPKKVKPKMVVVEYQLSEKFKIPAGIDLNDKKQVVSWGVKWNKMTIQLVSGGELEVESEGWTTDFDFKRPSSIGEIEDDDEEC